MEAFRTIIRATQGPITVDLPPALHSRMVEIVVMPVDDIPAASAGWSADFFTAVAGAWAGEPLRRAPQGEYEIRQPLE